MKKIILVLLSFVLFGCSFSQAPEQIDNRNKYIKQLSTTNYYDILNDEAKAIIDEINLDNEEKENYLFEMWGKSLPDCVAKDIYGKDVDFNSLKKSKVIIEIAQSACVHCKDEMKNFAEIAKLNSDITFIQFFAIGDKDTICSFYEKSGQDFVDEIIVIPQEDNLCEIFDEMYGAKYTPTFLFFNNNVLTYSKVGSFNKPIFNALYDVAFYNKLPLSSLTTNDGESIFDTKRDYDDVYNSFSKENIEKLNKLNEALDFTINNTGKTVDYSDLYESIDDPKYEIDDYTKFVNNDLCVFYVGNIHDNLDDDFSLINEFKKKHEELNILVILMDNKDFNTTSAYEELNMVVDYDVISSDSKIPSTLLDIETETYPACVYIKDNQIMGGFYNMKDISELEYGYNLFMTDGSITLIENN